ncbi:hypothetical protein BJG93_25585 [Paraburkholderia sprentiae WSM5005]|uniref:DUF4148 domain-containing protein n=1 Tax=Paraburkholderia sprentiae WSM5005 TaxID=754502 RepID=A0A1I9YR63_9BURK|nr:hypothetical protein [Paraburkholderia sprentiae]APA88684.1 hypothetical protein BJG93_25585 [Paraburkholderia sprentiae WSM5005]
MRVRILMIAATAVLFLVPRTAAADELSGQADPAMSGRAMMQHDADESAQATTDMSFGHSWDAREQGVRNASYGGVPAGESQAGGRRSQSCSFGTECKTYFGQ